MRTTLMLLSICMLLSVSITYGQSKKPLITLMPLFDQDKPGDFVLPTFPGGENALHNHIFMQLKQAEREVGESIIGLASYETYISFTLDETGKIGNVKQVKSSANFPTMDQKVIEIVKQMPNWNPYLENQAPKPISLGLIVNYNSTTAHMKLD